MSRPDDETAKTPPVGEPSAAPAVSRPDGTPVPARRELREFLNPGQGLFYYVGPSLVQARTAYQRAEIVESEALGRVLLLDGVTQLAERWEYRYHEPMVHPALLAHPNPKAVLVIGGGDGACSARCCSIRR